MWIYSCFFLSVALFRTQFPLKKKHSLLLIWRLSCSLSGYWWPASQRNTLISGCKGTTIFLENNHSYINIYDYLTQKTSTTWGNYPINISDGKQEKTHYKNRNQHPEMPLPRVGNKLTANWRCSRRITTCCHICHSYPADISRNS